MAATIIDFNSAPRQDEPLRREVDADDIRTRLTASTEAFIKWLFGGRAAFTRHAARIGNVEGTPGSSLSIKLTGADRGAWYDHATQECGGDLISLYRANMGYAGTENFVLSLKEIAKEFLGDPVEIERAPWQPTATQRIEEKKAKLGDRPREEHAELGAPVAIFDYFDLKGAKVAAVHRFEPDGTREGKTFRPYCRKYNPESKQYYWGMGAPDKRILYHLADLVTAQTIIWCEGEGKADALRDAGYVTTSAMQGANTQLEKIDWDAVPLNGKTIIIWPDKDKPGYDYAQKVAQHLSRICTVKIVTPPDDVETGWDAADCLASDSKYNPKDLIAAAVAFNEPPDNIYKLYTLDELDSIPPPRWLVDKILVANGLSLFWGSSDSFKTFVAIDIAMSIATGMAWQGYDVIAGPVVYVAAEDIAGVKKRMRGWLDTGERREKGLQPNITVLRDSYVVASADTDKLIRSIELLPTRPVLIIIDTLAMSFGVGDENKTQDMNAFVLGCRRLREATGATVLIIHHTGRNPEQERGNVALRGACDVIVSIKRDGGDERVKLINRPPKGKQKNAAPFADISLLLKETAFEYEGVQTTTLVVTDDVGSIIAPAPTPSDEDGSTHRLGARQKEILNLLQQAALVGQGRTVQQLHEIMSCDKDTIRDSLVTLGNKELVVSELDATDPKKQRQIYKLATLGDSKHPG